MAGYVTEAELRSAIWPGMFNQLFDDTGAGSVSTGSASVLQVLALAHAEVTSYLPRAYDVVPSETDGAISQLLKLAELDFARAFSFARKPEIAEKLGENYIETMFKRATTRMENVATAVQQIAPNDNPPASTPSTAGGIIYDNGPRVLSDSADGRTNSGDF